jgi:hypothetical protein
MVHIKSPRGLSPGVGPLFMLRLLPLLVAAIVATLVWPEFTCFPTRPNAPFVAAGLVWLSVTPGLPRVVWQFVAEPGGDGGSRLIVRWKSALPPGFAMELFNKTLLERVHFIMKERLLRGVKERAER